MSDADLVVVALPTIAEALPGVDPVSRTDDEDRAYNAACTTLVRAALEAERAEGRPARVRTVYPGQAEAEGDVVELDDDGGIRIVDSGEEGAS